MEKKWRLLASQTWVILLAALLLYLSSYLINVLLWLGGTVGEENEETAFMAVFSFYRLLHRKRYWKPFMVHLRLPLFHPLICLRQLLREGTLDTNTRWTWAAFMSVCHLDVNQGCTRYTILCTNNIYHIYTTLIHNQWFCHTQWFYPRSSSSWMKDKNRCKHIELISNVTLKVWVLRKCMSLPPQKHRAFKNAF